MSGRCFLLYGTGVWIESSEPRQESTAVFGSVGSWKVTSGWGSVLRTLGLLLCGVCALLLC